MIRQSTKRPFDAISTARRISPRTRIESLTEDLTPQVPTLSQDVPVTGQAYLFQQTCSLTGKCSSKVLRKRMSIDECHQPIDSSMKVAQYAFIDCTNLDTASIGQLRYPSTKLVIRVGTHLYCTKHHSHTLMMMNMYTSMIEH